MGFAFEGVFGAMGRWACAAAGLFALAQSGASAAAAHEGLIMGVSYGPAPVRTAAQGAGLPQDDWMADEAVAMWGLAGRADLRNMRKLGANMVRLYGNNPANSHTNFLDTALSEGLSVATGMSDYPYYQMVPGNCQTTGFDCFSQVKPLYAENLQKGFLVEGQQYHPAIKYMNILNEPDLKMPPTATVGDETGIMDMCRSLISAFDAMLEAEKEANVNGTTLINFTATFSYATCASCAEFSSKPALGQIAQLDDAMRNPEKYGYTPLNNITAAYEARFTHSFNTQNPATDLQDQFLSDYVARFPTTPVYIGEYHRVHADQVEDLTMILGMAKKTPLFLGISFFQYQVAYWKGGTETEFGMFGLSNKSLLSMPYFGKLYHVDCLVEQPNPESGMSIPDAVTQVFGGEGLEAEQLCGISAWRVPLNQTGYAQVQAAGSADVMEDFLMRLVGHLGKSVKPSGLPGVQDMAGRLLQDDAANFAQVVDTLRKSPEWMLSEPGARCVADRSASPASMISAVDAWCSQATTFSCKDIPEDCTESPYSRGDYVFSRRYQELGKSAEPLADCDAGGAAVFAPAEQFMTHPWSRRCVAGAEALPEPEDPVTPLPSRGRGHDGLDESATATTTTGGAPGSASPTAAPGKQNNFLPKSGAGAAGASASLRLLALASFARVALAA